MFKASDYNFIWQFKEFIDELNQSNSRNYKMEVLKKYADNNCIKYFLNFLYNPYIVTGISDKKLNKNVEVTAENLFADNMKDRKLWIDYPEDSEIFEYAKNHNTGTDGNIWTIQHFRETHIKPELHDLFNKMITKNLPLRIDVLTINKCIPNLIPTFNVMLANKYFEKPEVVEGKEFVLTTKIDGSRIIAMKNKGVVSFWTRQGQAYEGLVDLEQELLNSPEDNFVFDGEIVAIETTKEDTYKNTMKLSRTKDKEKHGLKMLVFDYMPVKCFLDQNCGLPYEARRATVTALFAFNQFKYFELLPVLYKGSNTFKIVEVLNEQTAKGEEGIMINILDAPYDFKRTNNLLKVKKFQDTELKVIGFEEGTNKLKGKLGAFICEYKNNEVRVGSGLTDEDREYFWNHQTETLYKYITVKYFEESVDSKTGLPSLRFPIFMRIREDYIKVDVGEPVYVY